MKRISPLMVIFMRLLGMRMYKVVIEWLDDEKMFVAYSDNIDGLMLEAATLNEMVESLQDIVPILLEENGQVSREQRQEKINFDLHIRSPLSNLSRSALST